MVFNCQLNSVDTVRTCLMTWNDLDNDGIVDQNFDKNRTVGIDNDTTCTTLEMPDQQRLQPQVLC